MNLRRGLHRLFFVATACWYVWGGLQIYNVRSDRSSRLERCLDAARTKDDSGAQLTESMCHSYYKDEVEWVEIVSIALAPALVYGIGRIAAWVITGFRSSSN
jgi:hypothetical protein